MSVGQPLNREESLERIRTRSTPWDMVVVGGGATGVGVAMDAASRGLDVVLVERFDFGKGTSSRSTKLIHGGVRYLEQGNLTLVRDALRERSLLRKNAPTSVHPLAFVIPCDRLWDRFYYWIGLKLYDLLGRGKDFPGSHALSPAAMKEHLPTLANHGHRGGVVYHDGQFDDTELLFRMVRTAAVRGACLANYVVAKTLSKDAQGHVNGIEVIDQESGAAHSIRGRAVVNATGPFCDELRAADDPNSDPLVAASQGVHVTLPKRFFPGSSALIVPKTSDGRVLFLIPWHDHVLVGTTDTPIDKAVVEPQALSSEIEFLLDTASAYLETPLTREDVLSVFTGIRPLVKDDPSARTASLSRDHKIVVSDTGLITITGGKWTTVRKMSEDVVNRAVRVAGLNAQPCQTDEQRLESKSTRDRNEGANDERLHPDLPYYVGDILHSVRTEMARTVEDVLARRTRALFLNVRAAVEMAPAVARLMASELNKDEDWCREQITAIESLAESYGLRLIDSSSK